MTWADVVAIEAIYLFLMACFLALVLYWINK
jgi:hypothetical protein